MGGQKPLKASLEISTQNPVACKHAGSANRIPGVLAGRGDILVDFFYSRGIIISAMNPAPPVIGLIVDL